MAKSKFKRGDIVRCRDGALRVVTAVVEVKSPPIEIKLGQVWRCAFNDGPTYVNGRRMVLIKRIRAGGSLYWFAVELFDDEDVSTSSVTS